jgi:RNA polymerase sigma factor for flagellar operon FliA
MDGLEQYLPLIERIAKHIAKRLPDKVQLDDLLGAGALALVEASRNYEARNDASFETFAAYRIKGAMIDELRSHTWLPRRVSREIRSINDAQWRLEQQLGREPTKLELAKESGLDVHKILSDFHQAEMELSDEHEEEIVISNPDPAEKFADIEVIEAIINAIDALDDREQRIIYMMYDEGLEQQVVARVLDVSASRICQLHKNAINRLRKRLAA